LRYRVPQILWFIIRLAYIRLILLQSCEPNSSNQSGLYEGGVNGGYKEKDMSDKCNCDL